ncbi:hypothetical protein BJ875DRAFT_482431 [Amylocarpus encephaloides]|uniref:Uncharacterized protein n=1 Tax=Amylocarpus encephaloides TaxID=45428 RepID=A0A9P7YNI7_9HELO|nr:hypothetical protein BJ875DRAFT_482431 [Amylocarpus encephaloides]
MHWLLTIVAFLSCCSQTTLALPKPPGEAGFGLGLLESIAITQYDDSSGLKAWMVPRTEIPDQTANPRTLVSGALKNYAAPTPLPTVTLGYQSDPSSIAAPLAILKNRDDDIVEDLSAVKKRMEAASSTNTRRPIPTEVEHHNMDMHTSVGYFDDTSGAFQPTTIRNTASSSFDALAHSTLQPLEPKSGFPKGSSVPSNTTYLISTTLTLTTQPGLWTHVGRRVVSRLSPRVIESRAKRNPNMEVSGASSDEDLTTTYIVFNPPTTTSTSLTSTTTTAHRSTESPKEVVQFTTITRFKTRPPTSTRRVTITQTVTKVSKVPRGDYSIEKPDVWTSTETVTKVFKSTTTTATVTLTYSANNNTTNSWDTSPTAPYYPLPTAPSYTSLTSLWSLSTAKSSRPSNPTSSSHYKTWPGLITKSTSTETEAWMWTLGVETESSGTLTATDESSTTAPVSKNSTNPQTTCTQEGEPSPTTESVYYGGPAKEVSPP